MSQHHSQRSSQKHVLLPACHCGTVGLGEGNGEPRKSDRQGFFAGWGCPAGEQAGPYAIVLWPLLQNRNTGTKVESCIVRFRILSPRVQETGIAYPWPLWKNGGCVRFARTSFSSFCLAKPLLLESLSSGGWHVL